MPGRLFNMANAVTCLRIVLSVALLPVPVFSPAFYAMYLTAGVSDMIDGAIARKTGTAGDLGSTLDTAADMVLFAVCLIKLIPALDIPLWLIVWTAVIALIKVTGIISGYVLRKEFVAVHTMLNKAAGLALFLLPLTVFMIDLTCSGSLVCVLATLAALQEGHIIRRGAERK